MRTLFTALALVALLDLLGCSSMGQVARGDPCAIEASIACQADRTARVP